jgi:hypothetical protein
MNLPVRECKEISQRNTSHEIVFSQHGSPHPLPPGEEILKKFSVYLFFLGWL